LKTFSEGFHYNMNGWRVLEIKHDQQGTCTLYIFLSIVAICHFDVTGMYLVFQSNLFCPSEMCANSEELLVQVSQYGGSELL
jgi:hypothetical protein